MRKLVIVLLVIFNTLLLTGCWDRREINDIAIVLAAGIDKTDNGDICLSILVPIPKMLSNTGGGGSGGGGGDKAPALLISECGAGILDAFRKVQAKLPREIMFSHIKFIVIGEHLARAGVTEALDFFIRYRQANLRAHVLFTRADVDAILAGEPGLERSIAELIAEEGNMQMGIKMDLKDFVSMLSEEGGNPLAAQLALVPLTAETKKRTDDQQSKTAKKYISLQGAALFNKDKLAGWVDDLDMRNIMWIRNEIKHGNSAITIDIPAERGGGKVGVRIRDSHVKLAPYVSNETLQMKITLSVQGIIYESSSKMDLSQSEAVYLIERAVEEQIVASIQRGLATMQQEHKADVVGFGAAVYRQYPEEWFANYKDSWAERFSLLPTQIVCKVSIPRVGFITTPLPLPESDIQKSTK